MMSEASSAEGARARLTAPKEGVETFSFHQLY